MRDADTAMYRAKDEGPGRSTIFDTSMHDRVRERIELEAALRTALAEGQLRVAYQPIVQMDTGRPLGAEALVRWDHPERGPIPPMTFIPIAEDSGMIGAIGTWVREEALRQLGRWRADGTVGRRLLPVHQRLAAPAAATRSCRWWWPAELLRFGVPARSVALEMTESVMVDGSSVTARVLFELRELGLRLLVDDFGTGFSALGYLRKFPVTGVKIDRSFVSGLGAEQRGRGDRPGGGGDELRPGPEHRGRGRGDPAAARRPGRGGRHPGAGLAVGPGGDAGGFRRALARRRSRRARGRRDRRWRRR